MKTLLFNGSPHPNGDTMTLTNELIQHLSGEVKQVNAYDNHIRPCTDCRYCWEKEGCAIQDEMQEVYHDICTCDTIVIASPLYFSELTGPLLSVASRLQMFYAARYFRHKPIEIRKKRGIVVLCGGGDGKPDKAEQTAVCLLHQMNAEYVGKLFSLHTNTTPVKNDVSVLSEIPKLAAILNAKPNYTNAQ